MHIVVSNKNDVVSNKEMKMAARYMYGLLVPQEIYKKTEIYLFNCMLPQRKCGSATKIKDTTNKFRIKINKKMKKKEQLMTLAHELTHVKQYMLGELEELNESGSIVMYKNEYYDGTNVHYYLWPWEIEAFGRMYGLYRLWVLHKRHEKLNFTLHSRRNR